MASDPGTVTRLQRLLLDSLKNGLRGSMVGTPSTSNVYRYAPGSTGPTVTVQTPFSPFVMAKDGPEPGMSPRERRTSVEPGAKSRKVMRRSAETSGDA